MADTALESMPLASMPVTGKDAKDGRPRALRRACAVAAAAVMCLVLAPACGPGSSGGADEPAAGSGAGLGPSHKLLPPEVAEKGSITVASSIGYPPFEFYKADRKTIQGLDYDIAQAMGERLGIKFEFKDTRFPTIIPGLKNRRYDVAMSSIEDTAERREVVDFVNYVHSGYVLLVTKENPAGVESQDAMCGKRIAAVAGQVNVKFLEADSKECVDAGKPAIEIKQFPRTTETILALRANRTDAVLTGYGPATHLVRTTDEFALAGGVTHQGVKGIALPKGNEQLAKALRAAVQEVIDDGTHAEILKKWGLSKLALEKATINGGA